jgi:hypothetical protein
MNEPFLRFEWHVANAYHWQDWLDPRGKPIVLRDRGLMTLDSPTGVERTWQTFRKKGRKVGPVIGVVGDAGTARTYPPMSRENAMLFRRFADIDYHEQTLIHDFVCRYGLLGLEQQDQSILVGKGPQRHHYARGESYLDWVREICLMREALDLTRSKSAKEEAEDLANWRRVGLEPPTGERREKLAWLFNLHLQHVQGRMILAPNQPPQLSFAPLTLLSAMWLQLALSFAGDKEFRACKHCRRLIEISTDQTGFRRHREFCSATCKTLDYRKRRRTAIKLAKSGETLATIATQTETDRATVRGWIASESGRKSEKG